MTAIKKTDKAFPGGSVVKKKKKKNPPSNAGDMDSLPDPGRFHKLQGN